MAACSVPENRQRRVFWSTRPVSDSGQAFLCGSECAVPGLEKVEHQDGTTISTEDWLTGLVMNMLMTSGRRTDTPCGHAPGTQGGHWSESYGQGLTVGTLLRTVEPSARVNDVKNMVQAHASSTLSRLVSYGVANEVQVTATYAGGGVFNIEAVISGTPEGVTRVGVSGRRLENGWIWEN